MLENGAVGLVFLIGTEDGQVIVVECCFLESRQGRVSLNACRVSLCLGISVLRQRLGLCDEVVDKALVVGLRWGARDLKRRSGSVAKLLILVSHKPHGHGGGAYLLLGPPRRPLTIRATGLLMCPPLLQTASAVSLHTH